MKVYLTPEFLDLLYSQEEDVRKNYAKANDFIKQDNYRKLHNNITINISVIENIITNLPCVIKSESPAKYEKLLNNDPISRTEGFLKKILQKGNVDFSAITSDDDLLEVNDSISLYFYRLNNFDKKDWGIISKDNSIDISRSYVDTQKAIISFSGNFYSIKDLIPPTNSLLILDKYIFGRPYEQKLQNLLLLINLLRDRCRNIDFHLTIIYSVISGSPRGICEEGNVQTAYDEIIKQKNIKVELIRIDNHRFRDRFIFTNYTLLSIGHPFENRVTTFLQSFIPSPSSTSPNDSELRSYNRYLYEIREFIQSTCKKFPDYRLANDNKFTNRLFEHLEDFHPEP